MTACRSSSASAHCQRSEAGQLLPRARYPSSQFGPHHESSELSAWFSIGTSRPGIGKLGNNGRIDGKPVWATVNRDCPQSKNMGSWTEAANWAEVVLAAALVATPIWYAWESRQPRHVATGTLSELLCAEREMLRDSRRRWQSVSETRGPVSMKFQIGSEPWKCSKW